MSGILSRHLAPGPTGYPVLGVFPMARRDPLGFFMNCARRYGDVVAMRLGAHRVYLLSHPDHVKHVLQDNAGAYAKDPTATRVRALFGDSLTVVDGERWRRRRRRVQPAFQPGQHAHFASVISRATAEMLERWRPFADRGEARELVHEMRRLTQTIIIRACFGEVPSVEVESVSQALDVAVAHVEHRLWSPLGWLEVPTPAGARYRHALAAVEAFVFRMVSEARRSTPRPNTVLSALLNAPTGAESLTTAEVNDELKALLVAGHTTTASALAWIWYVLSENHEARDRLEEDCRAVLRGRTPGIEDLSSLGYTRRVTEEVLRLYPPTWLTARTPVADDTVGGYSIRSGALVLLSPYLTHRHPAVWDDPERFDPDRFTPTRAVARPAFAYFPFGGGPRRCIGSSFATTEMQLIVATVAQRYRLTLLPGAGVTPVASLTLRPSPAVPAQLHRR
jgi:cytochrome P450